MRRSSQAWRSGRPTARSGRARRFSIRAYLWIGALLAAASFAGPAAADDEVLRLVIFGDSLSDTGNLFDLFGIPGPPNWQGRFSNGPVWVEELAAQLGVPAPVHSLAGGTNYAYGGAETGSGGFFGLLNMGGQVTRYLNTGPDPAPGDLFVLLGGANDFLNGQSNPAVPVANLSLRIQSLAAAGAQRFLIANLPPIGQTPRFRGTPDEAVFDQLAVDFNDLYAQELTQLETSLGITVERLDLFVAFDEILADPAAYGLTNVTDPAYDGSTIVPNPDEYLFWDDIHPTRVGHALLGDCAADLLAPAGVPGDVNGDWLVGFDDLLLVLSAWGPCAGACPEDLDGDGAVGFDDLLIVLANWG
jgi:phospholipase/lecithinase/hemolysin